MAFALDTMELAELVTLRACALRNLMDDVIFRAAIPDPEMTRVIEARTAANRLIDAANAWAERVEIEGRSKR